MKKHRLLDIFEKLQELSAQINNEELTEHLEELGKEISLLEGEPGGNHPRNPPPNR